MMKVKYISRGKETSDGVLAFNRLSDTTARVHHFNNDDGHYSYSYDVNGTKEELDVIEEFSARLSEHWGKENPFTHMDCEHTFIEVSPQEANENSTYLVRGKKTDVHPGLEDYKIFKCSKCDEPGRRDTYMGYEVDLFNCDWEKKIISIIVDCLPRNQVPTEITDPYERAYYVLPSLHDELVSNGFERSGSIGAGSDNKRKYERSYKR